MGDTAPFTCALIEEILRFATLCHQPSDLAERLFDPHLVQLPLPAQLSSQGLNLLSEPNHSLAQRAQ